MIMAAYGYRLFTPQVFNGNRRKPVKLNDCGGEHYAAIAERLLKSLSGETMVGDAPLELGQDARSVKSEEEALNLGFRDQPAFRVEAVELVERTVRATVWAGKFGSHERALSATHSSEDADIQDKAASRSFRLIVALPSEGTTGVLAVEDISRSCPVSPLVRWLRWASQNEAVHGSRSGPNGDPRPWWRPVANALADENRLTEMIEAGQAQRLELVKRSITASRTRESEQFRVTAPLLDEGKVAQVAALVKSWFKKPVAGDESAPEEVITDQTAAKQLAAIVSPQIEDLDLDDGWVVLQDADENSKRISPSRVSEIFV
jgi:hypothetical protein